MNKNEQKSKEITREFYLYSNDDFNAMIDFINSNRGYLVDLHFNDEFGNETIEVTCFEHEIKE